MSDDRRREGKRRPASILSDFGRERRDSPIEIGERVERRGHDALVNLLSA